MSFPLRAAAFAALTLAPFVRFLVENRYSLLRTDSLAAASLFCLPALLLAALGRGRAFLPLLVGCSVLVATHSFQLQLAPLLTLSLPAAAGLLGVLLSVFAFLLRRNFAAILSVFSLSFLAAEFLASPLTRSVAAASPSKPLDHVLYLVLDGHIGLAGFPEGFPACLSAKTAVQSTLDSYSFTTYDHASSNYGVTLLSIPSILNQELPDTPDQFTSSHTPGGATIVSPNALFADFARRGFQVAVYQHRSIDFAAGSPDVHTRVDYSSEVTGLEQVPGWGRRTLWLVGDYQGSSPLLSKIRAFLPFRAGFHRTGPLAAATLWPDRLASDIAAARTRSLFFAHLLAPHEPYVFRADGSVRDAEEWTSDAPIPPLEPAAYQTRYTAYCEQVEALSGQLGDFLARLSADGTLSSMTIVIHGDHGSRIYLRGGNLRENLVNQFSALLAIRRPGVRAPSLDSTPAAVMTLLARDFRGAPPDAAADSVFWLDANGIPQRSPMQQLWRK